MEQSRLKSTPILSFAILVIAKKSWIFSDPILRPENQPQDLQYFYSNLSRSDFPSMRANRPRRSGIDTFRSFADQQSFSKHPGSCRGGVCQLAGCPRLKLAWPFKILNR